MTGRRQIGGGQRPVAALFVLFGLLLNVAGATGAQLDRDPRAARLGNGEIVRTAAGPRLASRIDDDGGDESETLAALPPAPQIVALATAAYPSGASVAPAPAGQPLDPCFPYQARAPPAA